MKSSTSQSNNFKEKRWMTGDKKKDKKIKPSTKWRKTRRRFHSTIVDYSRKEEEENKREKNRPLDIEPLDF